MERTPEGILKTPQEFKANEKLGTIVFEDSEACSRYVANQIDWLIRKPGGPVSIGLHVSSTFQGIADELLRKHQTEKLSFKNVHFFVLDEYWPIAPDSIQSHQRFMRENLLDLVDIPAENCHFFSGSITLEEIPGHCQQYEQTLERLGGLDLLLLSPSGQGHLIFNEPAGTPQNTKSRLVSLDPATRASAASEFFGLEYVPKKGLTAGVSTLFNAKSVFLMCFSESKARIVSQLVEESDPKLAGTIFQKHPKLSFILDPAAAYSLTQQKCPWMLKNALLHIDFRDELVRKAVIWLSLKVGKPILKLEEEDYIENNLLDLLADCGPASEINIRVYKHLAKTITGWPGGKRSSSLTDSQLPHCAFTKGATIFPKRVVVFSPHPDDMSFLWEEH